MKAQEQLVKLHAENLRLKRDSRDAEQETGSCSASVGGTAIGATNSHDTLAGVGGGSSPSREAPKSGANTVCAEADDIGHSLDSYRREVAILRQSLAARDARETQLVERQRQQHLDHDAAKQAWESQVAGLLCEVQDLESRNRQLENALRTLAGASSGVGSTAASAGGLSRPSSEAATLSGHEDLLANIGDSVT